MRPATAVLVLATLLVAWSEAAYYPLEQLDPVLVVFYAVPVWALVWCLRRWPPAGWPGVVLAGAVYGFVVEGVIVPVLYESPLFTTSYTSLAWHLVVSVLCGVVGVGLGLRTWPARRLAGLVVGLGLLLGLWWPAWWRDAGQVEPGVGGFAVVVAAVSVVTALGHAALQHLAPVLHRWALKRPARVETVALAGLVTLGWLAMAAANPVALVQLPVLLAVCAWGLRRASAPPGAAGVVAIAITEPFHWRRLLLLGVLPVVATATYAAAVATGLGPAEATDLATAFVAGPQWLLGYLVLLAALSRVRAWPVAAGVGRAGHHRQQTTPRPEDEQPWPTDPSVTR